MTDTVGLIFITWKHFCHKDAGGGCSLQATFLYTKICNNKLINTFLRKNDMLWTKIIASCWSQARSGSSKQGRSHFGQFCSYSLATEESGETMIDWSTFFRNCHQHKKILRPNVLRLGEPVKILFVIAPVPQNLCRSNPTIPLSATRSPCFFKAARSTQTCRS